MIADLADCLRRAAYSPAEGGWATFLRLLRFLRRRAVAGNTSVFLPVHPCRTGRSRHAGARAGCPRHTRALAPSQRATATVWCGPGPRAVRPRSWGRQIRPPIRPPKIRVPGPKTAFSGAPVRMPPSERHAIVVGGLNFSRKKAAFGLGSVAAALWWRASGTSPRRASVGPQTRFLAFGDPVPARRKSGEDAQPTKKRLAASLRTRLPPHWDHPADRTRVARF